ncbi:MAG: phage capsid protein [Firmicutes bacterium HGW-Firmicutes-2]|jgi:hypothetical protein|nr:MAG: phage capsid protein [Firmicutes bacterium HGW-Firmicutes-2]
MAITLLEAKKNVQDALTMGVIDEFRKSSFILDAMTFDDAVSPTGGGATLTYGYTRLTTQPTAAFRDVNEEYTPSNVAKLRYTADLKVFGGSFEIDRIIANMGGIVGEVQLNIEQKVKAARALFNDTFINGDAAVNAKAFDGLEKALTGSSTEFDPGTAIDLSTSANIDTNYKYFIDALDEFLLGLDGKPDFLAVNSKLLAKLRACARRVGTYSTTSNEWGVNVGAYDGITLVDMGTKAGTNDNVISTDGSTGVTSLYAGRLGMDGLHGISMAGQSPVNIWLPDFSTAGAVKKGEVEMVAAIALKASKAAGVMRKIKVQ